MRASVPRYVAALASDDVAERPDPATWSVLEYAAHVRDVFGIFEERLALMLGEENPHFPNWDQDATAVAGRYDAQDPQQVGAELTGAGVRVAAAFDAVEPGQWERAGLRSNARPSPSTRSASTSCTTSSITSTTSGRTERVPAGSVT